MYLKFHVDDDTNVLVARRSSQETPSLNDVVHRGDIKTFNKFRQKLDEGSYWVTLIKENDKLSVSIPVEFSNHQMKFPAGM